MTDWCACGRRVVDCDGSRAACVSRRRQFLAEVEAIEALYASAASFDAAHVEPDEEEVEPDDTRRAALDHRGRP